MKASAMLRPLLDGRCRPGEIGSKCLGIRLSLCVDNYVESPDYSGT